MATTWFAQNSSVNIDSASQWNSVAGGGGTVLTFANLDPTDTLVANGKTSIAINVSFTCATVTNLATGGTASGGFVLAAGITVTANVTSGTSTCITRSAAGADSYIVGNVTGGSVNLGVGLENSSTGIVRITGNVTGGSISSNTWAVANSGSGHIYITGNVTCPVGNVYQGYGVYNTGTGNVDITGNVTGTGAYAAVQNNSTGRIYVTGNVTGASSGSAPGIQNQSTGIVVVNGTITGGTNASGYVGVVVGSLLYHTGDSVTGAGAPYAVGGIGKVRIGATAQTTFSLMTYDTSTLTETASRSLYTGGVNLNQPVVANVRSGTVYGASSEYTGTLIVPLSQYVNAGVGTDNTVGTSATPTAAEIATAVWTNTTAADFTTALSIGKSIMNGVSLGTGLTVTNLTNAPTSGNLTAAMKASVHTEVLNSLSVDTFPELSGVPAATSTLKDKLSWIFMWSRNKSTETSSERKLYADDTTTVVSTETVSDNGTTFTKDEAS